MAKSSAGDQLGIVRSTAVISLGLVALAGSIAASLCRRIMTAPTAAQAVRHHRFRDWRWTNGTRI